MSLSSMYHESKSLMTAESSSDDAAHGPRDGEDWIDVSESEVESDAEKASIPRFDGIEISLEKDIEDIKKKRRRFNWTKEDKELARLVHRSHLGCLLGRALLYDRAANDDLLQALMYSLMPLELLDAIDAEAIAGNSAPGTASTPPPWSATANDLKMVVKVQEWFRSEFKVRTCDPYPRQNTVDNVHDEISFALSRAQGLEAVKEDLYSVAKRRSGSEEELVVLFAALLRGVGCFVRTIHVLEPSPLKPGDAARQQEHIIKAFLRRSRNTNGSASQVVGLATGSGVKNESVLDGDDSFRVESRAVESSLENSRANGSGAHNAESDVIKKKKKKQSKAVESKSATGGSNSSRKASSRKQASELSRNNVKEAIEQPSKRKRKGDMEEEMAMAMAIAATDFEKLSQHEYDKDGFCRGRAKDGDPPVIDKNDDDDNEQSNNNSGKKRRKARGQVPGAAFDRHQQLAAKHWLEVLCIERSQHEDEIADAFHTKDNFMNAMKCRNTTILKDLKGDYARKNGTVKPIDEGRWVHVDPITGWYDRPENVEGLVARDQTLAYVIACSGGGAKDVTRRYASNFLASLKQRDEFWWEDVIRPLRTKEVAAMATWQSWRALDLSEKSNRGEIYRQIDTYLDENRIQAQDRVVRGKEKHVSSSNHVQVAEVIAAREDAEFRARAMVEKKALPRTIEGFKNHPFYILNRHIGKYQALNPGAQVVGLHRGESYYWRRDIGDVHTTERWKRLGREVLPEELDRPVKRIKKRNVPLKAKPSWNGRRSSFASDISTPNVEEEERRDLSSMVSLDGDFNGKGNGPKSENVSAFYGEWQTREWAPPPAVGGNVPKNERGNVEVPPFASSLPAGTRHIQLPGIAGICRRLGIDWAHALVGFDIRGGRSVPKIDGVVVCTEHEDAVREAYHEDLRYKAEQARQQRLREAEDAWRDLLRALITRVQLGEAYGKGSQKEAAAEMVHRQTANAVGRERAKSVHPKSQRTALASCAEDKQDAVGRRSRDRSDQIDNKTSRELQGSRTEPTDEMNVQMEEI